ncbi:MAG: DUF1569 domain-containing protein [Terracidiphilus sp.]|jgi:hypothetical protein
MKNLYQSSSAQEIKQRIARLQPDSRQQSGKMNVAQAVAHCAKSMEWAVGDRIPQRMYFGRLMGIMVKPLVMRDDQPLRRDSPTSKDLVVADQRDLDQERPRLLALIDRFTTGGPQACTTRAHSFFGRLTPDEWAILMYKHLDHHLRQFGV